jgi:hypothetical protein
MRSLSSSTRIETSIGHSLSTPAVSAIAIRRSGGGARGGSRTPAPFRAPDPKVAALPYETKAFRTVAAVQVFRPCGALTRFLFRSSAIPSRDSPLRSRVLMRVRHP